MIDPRQIQENAEQVLERCRQAALRSGRPGDAVTVVAVTKSQPLEAALAAVETGIVHFGENRVQEAEDKWDACSRSGLTLHMVGRLQRNKARKAVRLFDVIHSLDSVALALKLSEAAEGKPQPVFVEVNVAGEASKVGFRPEQLQPALLEIAALPNLRLLGLMTIAPVVPSPEEARPVFAGLRRLGESLRAEIPALGAELSMGMTDDFEVAIEEGATLIRIGRAIFGPRQP